MLDSIIDKIMEVSSKTIEKPSTALIEFTQALHKFDDFYHKLLINKECCILTLHAFERLIVYKYNRCELIIPRNNQEWFLTPEPHSTGLSLSLHYLTRKAFIALGNLKGKDREMARTLILTKFVRYGHYVL